MARRLSISMVGATHDPVTAQEITTCAQRGEQAGFYRLHLTDHYFHKSPTFHSTSAFAVAAAATHSIPMGFCSFISPLRHVIVAAKELAFLDGLCDGRLAPGLAAGSSQAEFDAFGIPFNTRGRRLDEQIGLMKRLWTEDSVSHQGEFFQFDDVSLTPKPVQKPHPPIWIGSWTGPRAATRRIVEHAAGWQASGLHATFEEGIQGWRNIETMCEAMNRDPKTIERALVNVLVGIGDSREAGFEALHPNHRQHEDRLVLGTAEQVTERLGQIFDSGFDEVAVLLPVRALDQLDALAERVLPNFT